MADIKVSAKTELDATPDGGDVLYILDGGTVGVGGTDKKITVENLLGATRTGTINFVIDGGGSAITTGVKGDITIDFPCTITGVTTTADQSGSIVVDIWKDSYANYPATDADSITASAPPTLSSAQKAQDTTLTGWTTSISAGEHLVFNVDSATTVERVTIALTISRTI